MGISYDIDFTDYVPFETVSDEDLLRARIFNKCRMSETGCWVWKGSQDGKGYGLMSYGSKTMRAHRLSYMAFKGREIPEGLHILHGCDNPTCVNPAHLRAGTVKQNMADREARGRRDVRGEQVGTSKLTTAQVIEIKKSTLGLKALGEKYGVDAQSIWRIRKGKAWAHVKVSENSDGR